MKPVSPIFTHSQHPMQLFLLSPIWWMIVFGGTFGVFMLMQSLLPGLSILVSGVFFIASFVIVKIKLGRDRHSDIVLAMGVMWRARHWRGKISAGDQS